MKFDLAPLQVVRSITQHGLALYWDRIRKGRPLPALSEFEPGERTHDPEQLAFYSVECVDVRPRYRISHWGTRIAETYHSSWAGKWLDEVVPDVAKIQLLAAFDSCVQNASPIYMSARVADAAGKPVDCERLLLPFGNDIAVTHIIASLQLISIDGAFEHQRLLGGLTNPLHYSVAAVIKPGFSSDSEIKRKTDC